MAAQQKRTAETFGDFGDAVIEAPKATVKNDKPKPVERTKKATPERFFADASSPKVLDATQLYLNEIGTSY